MTERRQLTAVVCDSQQQFREWCLDQELNPRDPSMRLVLREDQARGYLFDRIILVGGRSELMDMVQCRLREPAESPA